LPLPALTLAQNHLLPAAEKDLHPMVRFDAISMNDHLAPAAGRDFRFPVSSKTKAKTTTKTV
jgi:hypothetical protein